MHINLLQNFENFKGFSKTFHINIYFKRLKTKVLTFVSSKNICSMVVNNCSLLKEMLPEKVAVFLM